VVELGVLQLQMLGMEEVLLLAIEVTADLVMEPPFMVMVQVGISKMVAEDVSTAAILICQGKGQV
jgi:hypothetical protein